MRQKKAIEELEEELRDAHDRIDHHESLQATVAELRNQLKESGERIDVLAERNTQALRDRDDALKKLDEVRLLYVECANANAIRAKETQLLIPPYKRQTSSWNVAARKPKRW